MTAPQASRISASRGWPPPSLPPGAAAARIVHDAGAGSATAGPRGAQRPPLSRGQAIYSTPHPSPPHPAPRHGATPTSAHGAPPGRPDAAGAAACGAPPPPCCPPPLYARRQPLPGRGYDRYLGANPLHAALTTPAHHPLTPSPPRHAPLQAPLAAARRPLQTGTALGKPAGDQALVAQQQQQALEEQQQQAQQAQQQQAEPVDQLEGEQPQAQLATTQQPTQQQPQQQQQPAAAATVQASQQLQQQGAQQQGVDEMFLCQDKLANATIVEQLPQLKIEQVLNSNKPRSPQDVTLVTQLSFERCVPALGLGVLALGLGGVGCWMARCIALGGL